MDKKDLQAEYMAYNNRLLLIHKNNLINKTSSNYKGLVKEIQQFYDDIYIKMQRELLKLTFDEDHKEDFQKATNIINKYYNACDAFSRKYRISSQSKFTSTFLEEISSYLFKDIPEIKTGEFGVYNKNIYAGLKLDSNKSVSVITKDVDFCIGKKVELAIADSIGNANKISIIVPIVAVEVKTYLDATMFGEVKSSSGAIKSASPNSHTYVLMGYKDLKDEHILAARNDSALTEMFVLRPDKGKPIDADALYDYWKEVSDAIKDVSKENSIKVPGKLLHRDD